jgi:hypothetical protein
MTPGLAEGLRRYSSRELIAVIAFAYVAIEYDLSADIMKELSKLLVFFLVGQYMVKVAQAVFVKPQAKPPSRKRVSKQKSVPKERKK